MTYPKIKPCPNCGEPPFLFGYEGYNGGISSWRVECDPCVEDLAVHRRDGTDPTQHNAALIVAMHTHLPALLDHIDALEARREGVQAVVDLALPVIEDDRRSFFECHTVDGDPRSLDNEEALILCQYDAAINAIRALAKPKEGC